MSESTQVTFPGRTVEWTPRERVVWSPPEDLTVSQWADRYRVLHPMTSAEAGPWRTSRTPYLREIMDSVSDPRVERVTLVASTQVGKTECLLNVLGYSIDQDPGPALVVMPREDDVISLGQRRIRPMLDATPQLSRHISDLKSDNLKKEIRFTRSMLYLAGSASPADLASRPIRYLIMDETDKYPRFSGREADPVSLASERTRTYSTRKIVMASTPTTRDGYIWREYEASDRCLYFVPCPLCGEYQSLEFAYVKFPEDERDPKVIRDQRLAWYECEKCGGKITDKDKPAMLSRGVWAAEGTSVSADGEFDKPPSPSHRGFRIHAIYSPWLTFSEVGAKFLEAHQSGDASLLMNFTNSWLGAVWAEKSESRSTDDIAARAIEYEESVVHERAVVLTCGVDVQDGHLYISVRAWGPREESWLVECRRIDAGLEALVDVVVNRVWTGSDGRKHRVRLCCIDSGYRTDEVYRFSREFADVVRPIKGQQRISGVPIRSNRIDKTVAGDPVRRSIRLWHIDTNHFKDKLARMMGAHDGEHGAWHLPTNPKPEYLRHMASEHKVFKRNRATGATTAVWEPKPGEKNNHWFDTEVYNCAAAEMLSVFALEESHLLAAKGRDVKEKVEQGGTGERWIERGKGRWLNG